MLVANRESGETLSLGDLWDKKELTALRSRERFHCPECNDQVIMKLGSKKIWHFAHQPGSTCENQYDRESVYHLSGKLKLYSWLKRQGINAELEKFDPLARQKPDIAFEWQGKKYALEFQCSIIPEDIIVKRTKTYLENGYIPIWIAAASLVKRTGINAVAISNFLYLFIRRPHHNWTISAFCPESNQFINLQGAVPISSRRTITHFEVHSIDKVTVNHLVSPSNKNYPIIKSWQSEIQKFKLRYLHHPGAHQNPYLLELYRNRLHILSLPPEIGVPVFSGPFIETPPLIWQTYLYLDIFRYLKEGNVIKHASIQDALINRVIQGQVQHRLLPAAGPGDYIQAVAEYVSLLSQFSVLAKMDRDVYKLNREMKVPDTIEEQKEAEFEFYSRYGKIIDSSFIK